MEPGVGAVSRAVSVETPIVLKCRKQSHRSAKGSAALQGLGCPNDIHLFLVASCKLLAIPVTKSGMLCYQDTLWDLLMKTFSGDATAGTPGIPKAQE